MIKHYVNEAGTSLILDTGILVGSASEKYIKYLKPDGTTSGSFSASFYSSYSGIAGAIGTYFLSHTLITSDFDQPGEWRFHAHIGAVDGTWNGEMVKFTVYDIFQ